MDGKKSKIIKKILLIIGLAIYITLSFAIIDKKPTFADSGFGTSYHSGGSSHSSSSSHSRSSSSGSSYRSSHSYDDDGEFTLTEAIIVLAVFGGIIAIGYIWPAISGRRGTTPTVNIPIDDSAIEAQIKQYIPDFNKQEFLNNGYKMYCDIQEAWMNFKLEDVKDVITDELYNMYESQLTTLEVKGEQNVMKDFALQRSFLKDVAKQNDTITITTGYIIEFYDYIAEQTSGKVLRGTDKRKVRVTYEMKFRQTLDQSKKVTKCPNCGADIEMNTTGICEYCRTKLVTENTKWVLTQKKTMNQEYV